MNDRDDTVTIWGIHARISGVADSLFLKKNMITIGWSQMGDLRQLPNDREAFKAKVAVQYAHRKPGVIPNFAGQLLRFAYTMQPDDLVIYPCKRDRQVHIGRIAGDYEYAPDRSDEYPNQRPVTWLNSFPRTQFSQGALYEIGSALALFQVKNYADEFLAALAGEAPPPIGPDDTVGPITAEIEQATRDFILKQLGKDLKGHPFAHFVGHLLNCMGYRTRVFPEGPDGGIDVIAHKDELGLEPPIIKVQVKSSEGNIGDPVVSALYGKVEPGEHGLFVALGSFTTNAKAFATTKSNLRLIDGDQLVDLVLQNYDRFDSKYKGLLPLKRVYVPEALDEGEG